MNTMKIISTVLICIMMLIILWFCSGLTWKKDKSSIIGFSFTPETVQQAAVVLRNELSKRGDLYDVFLASMRSAIDDDFWNTRETCGNDIDIGEDDFNEAAELMLNRLVGLEDN